MAGRWSVAALSRALRLVWRRWDEFVFAFDSSREVPPTPSRPGHTFRVVSLDSLDRGESLPDLEHVQQNEVIRRLRRGDRCCLAEIDGQTAGYSWAGFHRWDLDDLSISAPLSTDECYLYDAYVKPEFRRHGVFYSITQHLWETNRDRGIRKMYTRTRRGNAASIAGARHFGAVERLELKAIQLLSVLRIYSATLTTGTGDTIGLLTAPGTQIGPGLLKWSAMGRRGYRFSLSRRTANRV